VVTLTGNRNGSRLSSLRIAWFAIATLMQKPFDWNENFLQLLYEETYAK